MAASRAVRISLEWSARSLSARSGGRHRSSRVVQSCMRPRSTDLLATRAATCGRKSHAWGDVRSSWTDLFAAILLASQLHLAHTAGADGLAQDPLARLGRDGRARPRLLGDRGRRVAVAMGSGVRSG